MEKADSHKYVVENCVNFMIAFWPSSLYCARVRSQNSSNDTDSKTFFIVRSEIKSAENKQTLKMNIRSKKLCENNFSAQCSYQ